MSSDSKKGFTIIELVMYLALLSIFLGVMTDIFFNSLNLQSETNATSNVQDDAQYIIARLTYDIHRASSISSPSFGSPPVNSSSAATLIINGSNYTIASTGGTLKVNNTYRLNGYGTTISNVSFTRLGGSSAQKNALLINFTLTSVTKQNRGQEVRNYETTVATR
jgi:Tfp pilus assembly protein PilW